LKITDLLEIILKAEGSYLDRCGRGVSYLLYNMAIACILLVV